MDLLSGDDGEVTTSPSHAASENLVPSPSIDANATDKYAGTVVDESIGSTTLSTPIARSDAKRAIAEIAPFVVDNKHPLVLSSLLPGCAALTSAKGDTQVTSQTQTSYFKPYESSLKMLKAYRFSPSFRIEVAGGIKSLTYSHQLDVNLPICPTELLDGICTDTGCNAQHLSKAALSGASFVSFTPVKSVLEWYA